MNILTGLQPTGQLHIGNYLGAIKPLINRAKELQDDENLYLFIPDLHALSIELDYDTFYKVITDMVKIYVASGFPVSAFNAVIFQQSRIPAHAELLWVLSCFGYMGELQRMTQFKEKSAQHDKNINAGLFTYPLLMAADVLLYDVEFVPVGADQMQHVELMREISIRINNKFNSNIFTVPFETKKQIEMMSLVEPLRIRSLTNPLKKMSKSDPSDKSRINLNDKPEDAAKKIMAAATDSAGVTHWDWEHQPGVTSLMQIYAHVTGIGEQAARKQLSGMERYGDFKKIVAEAVSEFLFDFQTKLAVITDEEVEACLDKGALYANSVAKLKIERIYTTLGLRKAARAN